VPIEPPASSWAFPPADDADRHGIVGIGADLEPGTLLAAYRSGLFPMPIDRGRRLAWWSPDPRGVLPLDGFHVSRSLERSIGRYQIRVDTAFDAVVEGCASPDREGGWITPEIRRAYLRLHQLGWAHSIEAWNAGNQLAGGVYGVGIGGFFAGESMFHRERDASKVALAGLVSLLRERGASLLDVQWTTPHLLSLGAVDMARSTYLDRLRYAIAQPVHPFD
jgi:leucyl/phenylalanyl-tRNA---protein transferase